MAWNIIPNMVLEQPPSGAFNYPSVNYQFITTFEAAWGAGAIRMSGDGQALYSPTGNVFTVGTNTGVLPGNIYNTNAWFVVAPPDDSYFMLWRRSAFFGTTLSCSWSYNAFTGGNPTTLPTSPGEISVTSAGNVVAGGMTLVGTGGMICHGIFGDADEGYAFAFLNYPFGGQVGSFANTVVGGCFVDVAKPSFVNEDHQKLHVVCACTAANLASALNLTLVDVRADTQAGVANSNGHAYALFRGSTAPMSTFVMPFPSSPGARTQGYTFGWPGQHDAGPDMWPMVWTISNRGYSGEPLMKGESRLFRMTSQPNRVLTTRGWRSPLTFTDDLNWWLLGDAGSLAIPWDGVTDAYLAYAAP